VTKRQQRPPHLAAPGRLHAHLLPSHPLPSSSIPRFTPAVSAAVLSSAAAKVHSCLYGSAERSWRPPSPAMHTSGIARSKDGLPAGYGRMIPCTRWSCERVRDNARVSSSKNGDGKHLAVQHVVKEDGCKHHIRMSHSLAHLTPAALST